MEQLAMPASGDQRWLAQRISRRGAEIPSEWSLHETQGDSHLPLDGTVTHQPKSV